MVSRRYLLPVLSAFGLALSTAHAAAAEPVRRIAVHLDENDPERMNLVLNNVRNLYSYYRNRGEEIAVRIVTYGPGLHMFREDTSPVKDRLAAMTLELPNLSLAACENTQSGMSKQEGRPVTLIGEAELVPSGVVELVELQHQGWAYLRP